MCPHCGAFTAFSPLWLEGKGRLLERSTVGMQVWETVEITAVTNRGRSNTNYAVLTCQGCKECFVAEKEKYSDEWSAVYPIPHTPVAEEIPEPIKSEFKEARLCFAVEAYRGCLLVCRTALIDMQREQEVSSLKELKDKGIISNVLYGQANQVRLWGNLVGHEPVQPEAITTEDSEQLLTYLEALLDAIYVQPKRLSGLTEKLGQLKKGAKPKPPIKEGTKPEAPPLA